MFIPRPKGDIIYKKKELREKTSLSADLKWLPNDVKQSIFSRCRENFNQYLLNTTLHGLKYVGDRRITRLERFFFILMFVVVVIISAYFINNVWHKWDESPIVVTLNAYGTSVKDFPFPAVTICNMNRAQKSAVMRIPESSDKYPVLKTICRQSINTTVNSSLTGQWSFFREVLMDVTQPCEDMLVACRYGGIDMDCMNIFNAILTDGGLCCNFNGVHRKFMMNLRHNRSEHFHDNDYLEEMANNWTPEMGFQSDELKRHKYGYPRPGLGSGNHLGLRVILNAPTNEYYCPMANGFGYKVLLHSPNELPRVHHWGIEIANGFESRIVATPILSKGSRAVRRIPVHLRKCLFEDENKLKLYQIYSRANCQSEEEIELYETKCKCVLYFMPRLHHNTTICGQTDAECVEEVGERIRTDEMDDICQNGCHAINYDMSLSSTPIFDQSPILQKMDRLAKNTAVLHVYYQSSFYRSQNKEQFTGLTEFLSNIGGLLGLFMGFSVFSIVEIFYFLSIRPYCNYLKDGERRRQAIERMTQRLKQFKTRETVNMNSNDDHATRTSHFAIPHLN